MNLLAHLDLLTMITTAKISDGDSSGSEDTTSSEEEDETEDDFEQTNQLVEQIRESVSGALSATGIAVP